MFQTFVAFTVVSAAGLSIFEAEANSYITVLGAPDHAAFRLTHAQGFKVTVCRAINRVLTEAHFVHRSRQGIATVIGPIIAAHTFFVRLLFTALIIIARSHQSQ
jgi:fucose permease